MEDIIKKQGFFYASDGFWGRAAEELLREMLDPLRSLQRNRFRSGFLKLEAMERDRGRGTISQQIYVLLKREEEGFEGNSL